MVGPISLASTMALLLAIPQIKLVGTAADLPTALAQKPSAVPAVYVLAEERGSAPQGFTGVLVQTVEVALQVVIMVTHAAKPGQGQAARASMDQVIELVRTALIGWRPIAAANPLHFQAGRDESSAGTLLVSQQIFKTQYTIQVHL